MKIESRVFVGVGIVAMLAAIAAWALVHNRPMLPVALFFIGTASFLRAWVSEKVGKPRA